MSTVTLDLSDALAVRHALRRYMQASQKELRDIVREESQLSSDYAEFVHSYYCDAYREAHAVYLQINTQLGLDY